MLHISEKGMPFICFLPCTTVEEGFSPKVLLALFSAAVAEKGLLRVYEVLGQLWTSPATEPLSHVSRLTTPRSDTASAQ